MENDYKPTEEAHILPEKRHHWTWDDNMAKEARKSERCIQELAALPAVREFAAENGVSARALAAQLYKALPAGQAALLGS